MKGSNPRAVLAADMELGAGNVLLRLAEHGADMDMPRVTFDTDVDANPAWTPLSLRTLTQRAAARTEWFARHGIGRRDPVAVYVTSAADVFLNFFALTWLGAIPALMNGSMPPEIAVEFIRRLGAVGVLTDDDHSWLAGRDLAAPIIGYAADTGTGDPAAAPAHYRHHPDDPVAITHSSGTTRMPAAVVHSHHSLFAAVRAVRLTEPRQHGPVREMSAFPQAHTAGVIIMNEALCNGYELLCLSAQGGAFGSSGEIILDAIERWRPTAVYGFAVTWAELARYDLTKRDVSSVRFWSNSGDCAHEAHIRRLIAVGSHHAYKDGAVVSLPGVPVQRHARLHRDGIWRVRHQPPPRHRALRPLRWQATAVRRDHPGGPADRPGGAGRRGRYGRHEVADVGARLLERLRQHVPTRLNGYYLTGDLMYRDEEGYFYHVDRASDALDLGDGKWLYTALSEERILRHCPDVRDCTLLAVRGNDGRLTVDVLLALTEDAAPDRNREAEIRAALGDVAVELLLRVVAVPESEMVLGPTGKVRKFLMRQRLLASTSAS